MYFSLLMSLNGGNLQWASTIVIYESSVVKLNNLLVITSLDSQNYDCRSFTRLATGVQTTLTTQKMQRDLVAIFSRVG